MISAGRSWLQNLRKRSPDYEWMVCKRRSGLLTAICELDEDDTLRLLGNDDRWNYNRKYEPRRKKDVCDSSCIFH